MGKIVYTCDKICEGQGMSLPVVYETLYELLHSRLDGIFQFNQANSFTNIMTQTTSTYGIYVYIQIKQTGSFTHVDTIQLKRNISNPYSWTLTSINKKTVYDLFDPFSMRDLCLSFGEHMDSTFLLLEVGLFGKLNKIRKDNVSQDVVTNDDSDSEEEDIENITNAKIYKTDDFLNNLDKLLSLRNKDTQRNNKKKRQSSKTTKIDNDEKTENIKIENETLNDEKVEHLTFSSPNKYNSDEPQAEPSAPPLPVVDLTTEISNVLKDVGELTKKMHSEPLIEPVIFPEELFNEEDEDNQSESNYDQNQSDMDTDNDFDYPLCDCTDECNDSCKCTNTDCGCYDNHTNECELLVCKFKTQNSHHKCTCLSDIKTVHPVVEIVKKVKDNLDDVDLNTIPTNQEGDPELTNLAENIRQLENVKKSIVKSVNDLKKITNEEDINLSKFNCLIRDEENQIKQEIERDEQGKRIFESEKSYTYPKIYNKFFVKKTIKDWGNLPVMFAVKFVIYLFLDGKDENGHIVRERILDTEDEYHMFKLLFDSLVNDDFEPPEDEYESLIVEEFTETLPPIQMITADEIMEDLNREDHKNDALFKETEIIQHSADEDDDDQIESFAPPSVANSKNSKNSKRRAKNDVTYDEYE